MCKCKQIPNKKLFKKTFHLLTLLYFMLPVSLFGLFWIQIIFHKGKISFFKDFWKEYLGSTDSFYFLFLLSGLQEVKSLHKGRENKSLYYFFPNIVSEISSNTYSKLIWVKNSSTHNYFLYILVDALELILTQDFKKETVSGSYKIT